MLSSDWSISTAFVVHDPVDSSSLCCLVIGVFLRLSSFMTLVNLQSLIPSSFKFNCSACYSSIVSSDKKLSMVSCGHFQGYAFSTVELFAVFSKASAISFSSCRSLSVQYDLPFLLAFRGTVSFAALGTSCLQALRFWGCFLGWSWSWS